MLPHHGLEWRFRPAFRHGRRLDDHGYNVAHVNSLGKNGVRTLNGTRRQPPGSDASSLPYAETARTGDLLDLLTPPKKAVILIFNELAPPIPAGLPGGVRPHLCRKCRAPSRRTVAMSRMHPALALVGGSAVVLVVLIGMLAWPSFFGDQHITAVIVHCAAGLRGPMEEIAADYEHQTGRRVELNFDGSAPILARIDQSRIGDVFLPADESYIEIAKAKELVRDQDIIPLARMKAVLVVPADAGKIQTWTDVLDDKTKLALADPDRAAIGKLTREHLQRTGKW